MRNRTGAVLLVSTPFLALVALACVHPASQPGSVAVAVSKEPEGARSLCQPQEQLCESRKAQREGKLDRALRHLWKFSVRCPEYEPETWGMQLSLLVELGLSNEAASLAQRLSSARDMPADARDVLARFRGGQLHGPPPMSPDALVQEGFARRNQGDSVSARRAWDRALVALERETSQQARVAARMDYPSRALGMHGSADGRWLASRTADGWIVVWNFRDMREVYRLKTSEHSRAFEIEPGGRYLAYSTEEESHIFDLQSGHEVLRWEGASSAFHFSEDSRLLVLTRSLSGRVQELDILASLEQRRPVIRLNFSADRAQQTSRSATGNYLIQHLGEAPELAWNITRRTADGAVKPLRTLKGQDGALSARGGFLIYHAPGQGLAVLEGATEKEIPLDSSADCRYPTLSPQGHRAAARCGDAVVTWDARTGKLLQRYPGGPRVWEGAIGFDELGRWFAIAMNEDIHFVDSDRGTLIRPPWQPSVPLTTALASSADWLVWGDELGGLHGIRPEQAGSFWSTPGEQAEAILGLSFSQDGRLLAVVSRGRVQLRLPGGGVLREIKDKSAARGQISPDGQRLVVSHDDGVIRSYRAGDLSLEYEVQAASHAGALAFLAGGALVAVAVQHREVALLDASSGAERQRFTGSLGTSSLNLTASPDGRSLAVTGFRERVSLLDLDGSGKLVSRWSQPSGGWPHEAAFLSKDGSIALASSSWIRLMEPGQGQVQTSLSEPASAGFVGHLRPFSPTLLAASYTEGSAWLWHLPSQQPLVSLHADRNGSSAYALSSDGVIEWLGPPSELIGRPVCLVGPRSLPFELCEDRFVEAGLIARLVRAGPARGAASPSTSAP